MSLLSLEHVSKSYEDGRGSIRVLDDASLEIDAGDSVGIWGLRRSGKTTLLRVAAGRLRPDAGAVCFDGHDMAGMSAARRAKLQRHGGIGLLCSDWLPERNKPVIEHVALPLLSDGMSLREARAPAWRVLERVGVANCGYMPAGRLSQGERINVALAQALIHQPRLLLVDEPAVPAGPGQGVEFYELLRSLGREAGIAIVLASEDVAPIRKAARMMSIGGGRLRSMDQPGTLLRFPGPAGGRTR